MKDIELKNVGKSYGKKKVLEDICISVERGEIFGLLGPSGCGKSTTVRIMAGIERADEGEAVLCNKVVPDYEVMGKVGYMAQRSALYETLTAYENLVFFGKLYGLSRKELKKRIKEVVEIVDLQKDIKKAVRYYSGGMKQRLSLAITLLPNPQVVLLDEPTVGIDPLLRKNIWEQLHSLSAKGITIVVTTHVMDEIVHCHRIAMIREGRILLSGSPQEICERAGTDSIEEAFIQYSKGESR